MGNHSKMELTKFRRNIKVVRGSKAMTAKELSEAANLKQKKRVADIEEDRGVPTLDEVSSICDILEVGIDDMLFKVAVSKIEFT